MNLKLICASLVGVSSIGGAIAGGMYLSKSKKTENSQETNAEDSSKTEAVESNSAPTPPAKQPKPALQQVPPATSEPAVAQAPQVDSTVREAGPKGPTGP